MFFYFGNKAKKYAATGFLAEIEKMPAQAGADKVNNSLWTEERNPNNRHILPPIGVAVVLMTLYLAVQQHFVSCSYQPNTNLPSENIWSDLENDLKSQQQNGNNQNSILARLLEYEHICKDLEIFTKKLKSTRLAKKPALPDIERVDNIEKNECVETKKPSAATNKRRPIVPANKSIKYKFPVNTKKRHENKSKNSTAEPIIYMFALVFIYLLLKAASDINQHYKTQNKNDKRLRRCSLQSYAQSRRSTADRRASKEMYHSRLASSRSLSADHYQFGERSITGTHMTASALNDLSEKRQPIGTLPKNWQILKQSIKSDRFAVMKRTEMPHSETGPVGLAFQMQKITSPAQAVPSFSISRRPSVIDSLELNESKRRVRMIRH